METGNNASLRDAARWSAIKAPVAYPGWRYVSWPVALLLLISVGLKAEASFPRASVESLSIWRQVGDLAIVAIEWGIAAWILSGYEVVWARRAVLALFLILLLVAGTRAVRGQQDCGCFGRIHVNPLITIAIDAAAFIAICWCMVRNHDSLPPRPSGGGGVAEPAKRFRDRDNRCNPNPSRHVGCGPVYFSPCRSRNERIRARPTLLDRPTVSPFKPASTNKGRCRAGPLDRHHCQ